MSEDEQRASGSNAPPDGEDEEWTFEAAFEFTDDNHERLRKRIKELRVYPEIRKQQLLISRKLAEVCHDKDIKQHTIDSFMREESISLGEEAHHDLVRYLWNNRLGTDQWKLEGPFREPTGLFHALTNFLQIHQLSVDELSEEAVGTFVMWAPSLHVPGKYIQGKIEITREDETGAIRICETHVYKGHSGTTPLKEEFYGFIVRKSRHYIMFTRLRNGQPGPPRMVMIDNAITLDSKLMVMQGMVTGCYGANTLFSAPIYIERWTRTRDELDSLTDITDDIPDLVRKKLSLTIVDNVLRF